MTNPHVRITGSGASSLIPDGVTVSAMNREMIPEVRRIHLEAFAGYMNTRLGSSYIEAFLTWFLKAERAIALVALDRERKVIGYVLGAPIDYGKSMNHELFWVAAVSVLMRPWLFFSRTFWRIIGGRISSTLNLFPPHETGFHPPEPIMGLVAIGVAPSARGKKVGLFLMRAFEDKAHEIGMRSLQLTVYSNNAIARKLYESCNWRPVQVEAVENNAIKYVRILAEDANYLGLESAAQS
jgi:ribosomal protein S18 acetylase RimI-like enzyme